MLQTIVFIFMVVLGICENVMCENQGSELMVAAASADDEVIDLNNNPINTTIDLLSQQITAKTKELDDVKAVLSKLTAGTSEFIAKTAEVKNITDQLAVLTAQKDSNVYIAKKVLPVVQLIDDASQEAAVADALAGDEEESDTESPETTEADA